MPKILVTEPLAPRGTEQMEAAGHEVDIRLGLAEGELVGAVGGYDALVIRSETKVTARVLRAGRDLKVVGRAGIGLDNVDVPAATSLGIMVVNAPESNILSAAEHAFALLLAQARHVPQAHASLVSGRWERSKWGGVELFGKTLGIVGLGRIGGLVAARAAAFGMRLVAYDPYASAERAKKMGVELMSLDALVSVADFITIHLPKTSETTGLFGKELLGKCKPGVRIVNAARGGIVDEEALAQALGSGAVAGAALDVFASEPCTSSPLFSLPGVVVTPHLGASTVEAQDKAGVQIAEQVNLALAGDFAPYAVNVAAGSSSQTIRPFLNLAEDLGRFLASLCEGLPEGLAVSYEGGLSEEDTSHLTLAVLKGIFATSTEEPVSFVNAPVLAGEKGLQVVESSTSAARDYVNLVTVRGGGHAVAATLIGPRQIARIVMVDDHKLELPFAPNLLVVANDDRAGMVGLVGTALGGAGVSIASMAVGQTEAGISIKSRGRDGSSPAKSGPGAPVRTALMLLSTYVPVSSEVVESLRAKDGILDVRQASGPWSTTAITR